MKALRTSQNHDTDMTVEKLYSKWVGKCTYTSEDRYAFMEDLESLRIASESNGYEAAKKEFQKTDH